MFTPYYLLLFPYFHFRKLYTLAAEMQTTFFLFLKKTQFLTWIKKCCRSDLTPPAARIVFIQNRSKS